MFIDQEYYKQQLNTLLQGQYIQSGEPIPSPARQEAAKLFRLCPNQACILGYRTVYTLT